MTITFSRGLALGIAVLAAASSAAAKDKKPVDPNKPLCRSDLPTGSHFPVKICHTAAEWADIDGANGHAARVTLDRATRNGLGATGGASGL